MQDFLVKAADLYGGASNDSSLYRDPQPDSSFDPRLEDPRLAGGGAFGGENPFRQFQQTTTTTTTTTTTERTFENEQFAIFESET